METTQYEGVVSTHDITKLPISITTTDVNLTGSWKFFRPILKEKISPCSVACPSNINIPKYMMYLREGDLKTALHILREENPLPAVCGRVCPHFCEFECNRTNFDTSVSIRDIEKFLGDYGLDVAIKSPSQKLNKKVAIIGSGPAGLSCAYFLKKAGLQVTIFEREKKLGGMLQYGIPKYRLPKDILEREINNILSLGIEVNTEKEIKKDDLEKLKEKYDSIFIATGLWQSIIDDKFKVDNKNIFAGLDFLKGINQNIYNFKEQTVFIVGGGNVAVDIARTLLRMGNTPVIVYRRTIGEMPAFREEIEDLFEEKIKIIEKKVIKEIEKINNKLKIRLIEVKEIKEKNVILSDISEELFCDKVIFAIGQRSEINFEKSEKVFIGGDLLLGPSTVTEAIATGKKQAFQILKFLGIQDLNNIEEDFFRASQDYNSKEIVTFDKINTFYFQKEKRIEKEKIDLEKRINTFDEVYKTPNLESIVREAGRCFICGICNKCGTCWFSCPDVSIIYPKEENENISFDYSHCKGCGLCMTECPRGVIEMEEDK